MTKPDFAAQAKSLLLDHPLYRDACVAIAAALQSAYEQGLRDDTMRVELEAIMATYDRQDASPEGVDTPGGLEHMGDVWRLFHKWRKPQEPR